MRMAGARFWIMETCVRFFPSDGRGAMVTPTGTTLPSGAEIPFFAVDVARAIFMQFADAREVVRKVVGVGKSHPVFADDVGSFSSKYFAERVVKAADFAGN